MASISAFALGVIGGGCDDSTGAASKPDDGRLPSCRLLTVQPDATQPIELLTGVSNVNAALGSGGLTAASRAAGS